jgi:DNA-binding NtrC family response regulator
VARFGGHFSAAMPATVLIVDDEKNILLTLSQALQLAGYRTELASTGQTALELTSARPVDAVLLDVKLPDIDGLAAIEKLSSLRPGIPVIMMSGHGTIEMAVKATQLGARDFLEKPISRDRLLLALRNALQHQAAVEELAKLRSQLGEFEMIGKSPAMHRIYELIRRVAPSEGRVLITGENGTGKELVARAIHRYSRRSRGPFVQLNCAAVPHELIESELFGHERGAFTGAVAARRGKFELASEGTLFLDEIGDMPAPMQAKVLRVLQEGELERVGAGETLKVDVRVLAATNRDLEAEIRAGRFREDLYYRLNVVHLHCPPLRERREDLPEFVTAFLKEACQRNGKRPMQLAPDALTFLSTYEFPGNVRELKNLAERLTILCEGPVITAVEAAALMPKSRFKPQDSSKVSPKRVAETDAPGPEVAAAEMSPPASDPLAQPIVASVNLPPGSKRAGAGGPVEKTFREQVEDAEREIILNALAFTRDNVTEAAKLLDLERGHFYKKMKALGLRRGGDREG